MPVVALHPGYRGEIADREDRFHGNRLLYVGWDHHLMFGAPVCLPLPPSMPFAALLTDVLPGVYGSHPDFARIDWTKTFWLRSGAPWQPDPASTLEQNGLRHKSAIRFVTPGLDGIGGSFT